jgi:hypothetical protein
MMDEEKPCKPNRVERGESHCWHSTGMVLTSNPPQYPQVCCWCGAERTLRGLVPQREPGHGPYEPPR